MQRRIRAAADQLDVARSVEHVALHGDDWGCSPRIFILPLPLDERVHLDPVQYRAWF